MPTSPMIASSPAQAVQRSGCLVLIPVIPGLYQIILGFRVLYESAIFDGLLVIPSVLQAVLALGWGFALCTAAVAVARRKRSALPYTGWLVIGFVVYSLLQIVIFAQSDYDRGRIPFLIIIALVTTAVPVISLLSRDKQHLG